MFILQIMDGESGKHCLLINMSDKSAWNTGSLTKLSSMYKMKVQLGMIAII